MTLDDAVALTLVDNLPRIGLTARLQAEDPELLYLAASIAADARKTRADAAANQIDVIAWNDARYPASLLAIPDCPPALWYRGSPHVFERSAIAIVGSRAASAASLEVAAQIAADLAACGIVVVSGLARGVDSAAHRGALTTGQTVAVLGSGIERIYPSEHVALARDIARAGAVVSEYQPRANALPRRFPERNRLISGLSRGVIVIEASEKSGSLITARCALEQGREVMAVPGNVLSGRNRGGHALIRDGATIVECAADVLEALGWAGGSDPREPGRTATESKACDDCVRRNMDAGHPYDLDALAQASGLSPARLLPRLSELELCGLIRRTDDGRFIRRD